MFVKCVICGKESDKSICVDCYLSRNKIIEIEKIDLTVCPRCGMYRIEGKWRDLDLFDAVWCHLEKNIKIHPDFKVENVEMNLKDKKGEILLTGTFWGKKIKEFAEFQFKFNKVLCEKCSREAGGYYECILQLRVKGRKLEESEINEVNKIIIEILKKHKEDTKAFLSKVVERQEGIDYYIGGRNVGKKISKEVINRLGGVITESKKIAGRRDGREIYRFTYSIRLPSFRKGDVVVYREKPILITNPKINKGLSLPELKNVNVKNATMLIKKEEMDDGIVVNKDEYTLEVMILNSGKIVTVEKIGDVKIGDNVAIFEFLGKHYAIPKNLIE